MHLRQAFFIDGNGRGTAKNLSIQLSIFGNVGVSKNASLMILSKIEVAIVTETIKLSYELKMVPLARRKVHPPEIEIARFYRTSRKMSSIASRIDRHLDYSGVLQVKRAE